MAASGSQHLTLDERRSLFRMQKARLGVTEMAARLGRHRSTICRVTMPVQLHQKRG